ncbi:MAG: galactose mutarotase [Gloeobacteraceae cyanobacterium ES-bin-144]|nr:galactose mutarotase [Verrucomicrobiales bacterium]
MNIASSIHEEIYGKLPDGREVKIFTLTNDKGLKARVTEYGAILVSMETPDRMGIIADVSHGFDELDAWLANGPYFGATVGRFGNRIAGGKFTLDGKDYTLAKNSGSDGSECHLHGGEKGFNHVLWSGRALDDHTVEFSYLSQDGEEGYPGNLAVKVTYSLNDANELKWEASATTDAPTIVNIVHHSYWNLSGDPTTSICDHVMMIPAPGFLPTDAAMIPTGEIAPVLGTPMDFNQPMVIGARIDSDFEALRLGCGYDHCWVFERGDGLRLAARVEDPKTGRVMELSTNQPGMQFYSANFLDGTEVGKGGVGYGRRSAFCLETEGFPDSPNQASFPSPVLLPGQTYNHVMIHKFFTR